MRNPVPARPAFAAASLVLVTACLSPRVDASRYFTLPDDPGAGPGAVVPAPVASLGLGPVGLPPYLSRPELAVRKAPDELSYAAADRWAAPLDELFPRALAEALRTRLPARDVVRWPWPLSTPPEVTVAVDVLRFEADAGGGATLHARWTVTVRGREPASGETRVHEAGGPGDVPGSVAALGRTVAALAGDLARAARGGRG